MDITTITCGIVSTNTYILTKDKVNCVVIDPGEAQPVLEYLNENNLSCNEILLTHGHFDHILGLYDLVCKYKPVVWIHEKDKRMLFDDSCFVIPELSYPTKKIQSCNSFTDEALIPTCIGEITAIPTPGHSAGSCCYVIEEDKVIFTGDTIFYMGMGRTDFPDSSYDDIIHSINKILKRIPEDFKAFPGHGPSSNIGKTYPLN